MSYKKRAGLLPYRTSQGTIVYESKRDREAREERLGGVFFIGRKENGEIDWPEDWTDFEIENFLEAEREAASKLPDV